MSGSRRSRFKFLAIATLATVTSGLLLSYLPNLVGIWLASATIGILGAWTAFTCSRQPFQAFSDGESTGGTSRDEWTVEDWKSWTKAQADALQSESEAVAERERRLTEKLVRYHELLEFPDANKWLNSQDDASVLSNADREVQQILETEAAKVYENIRTNAYVVDGRVEVTRIRTDVFDLIGRVARVYQPDSSQPLLETSFNNLARAFSRICLHCLALLEQLPVDVRNYTLNELFIYFQRATKAYGAYQMVSPWMKRLGRTAYAGRLAAGANPVTLGAWWLASEVAQRGTRHVVSNVIDRQAIAVLHDLVSVVGTEVANIYGPGYRQRDAAWVYGSELTELLARFPTSRESLRLALKEMTALPLKCEYDRIYLYRCLATSKPAGFLLSDPAALPREQRNTIAVSLERFVNEVLHGIDDHALREWANETESRLDLKLKLAHEMTPRSRSAADLVCESVRSVWGFCVSVLAAGPDDTMRQLESHELLKLLPLEARQQLVSDLKNNQDPQFSVPDLDPTSELLPVYLTELFQCALASHRVEAHHYALMLETAMHFRLSAAETEQLMVQACRSSLSSSCVSEDIFKPLNDQQTIAAAVETRTDELVIDIFTSIEMERKLEDEDAALIVFKTPKSNSRRLTIVTVPFADHGPWNGITHWRVEPVEGYVYDDCKLTRIKEEAGDSERTPDTLSGVAEVTKLVLGGSILNRRFEKRFAHLIPSSE